MIGYNDLKKSDDNTLMQEIKERNGDALAMLFDRYYSRVMTVALRILKDRGEAEDMAQRIFLEVWEKAAQYKPERGRMFSWLMQIAYSRSIGRLDYLKVRHFWQHKDVAEFWQLDSKRSAIPQSPDQLTTKPAEECRLLINELLGMLTPKQRAAVELMCGEGFTAVEVARKTGDTFHSVHSAYYSGMRKIRKILEERKRIYDCRSESGTLSVGRG